MSEPPIRLAYSRPSPEPLSDKPLETSGSDGDPPGMDGRVTRLEEWAKLSDQRMGRMEDKLDGLGASLTDLKAHMITRRDLTDERRAQTNMLWASAGVVVAIVSAVVALVQVYGGAHTPPASPAPIVIQVPAATSAPTPPLR